jgi:hypothetical protein
MMSPEAEREHGLAGLQLRRVGEPQRRQRRAG